MDIELGKAVMSSDGARLGTVDRVVIDPETWELEEVILHKGGWFGEDRIVEVFLIDHIAEDGTVSLAVSAAEAERKLPFFVEAGYLVPTMDDRARMPVSIITAGGDPNAIIWRSTTTGYDRHPSFLFESAMLSESDLEMRSNLLIDEVTVNRGTHVVGSDGRRLGEVADLIYSDGHVGGIVVATGHITHHLVTIPTEWVESVTHKRVTLTLTAHEALEAAQREQAASPEGSGDG